jgi:hypothetical protein
VPKFKFTLSHNKNQKKGKENKMSEPLTPVNPDEIRGSYAKYDASVPQQITALLADKNIPEKFLKRKSLFKELEDSFDALQDSFSYGKVIKYSTNHRDTYYRQYEDEDEEEDEEENEESSEEEEYRPRTKRSTGNIKLKYRRNGNPDAEGETERIQDEEVEISFPSPIYLYEVGTNFLAEFDDSFEAKESFRELKLTMNPSYQMLLDASEISPFGHQSQTVIDPTVRKARHIPAERITDIEGFDLDEIVDNVRRKLFPQESKIQAKVSFFLIWGFVHK